MVKGDMIKKDKIVYEFDDFLESHLKLSYDLREKVSSKFKLSLKYN